MSGLKNKALSTITNTQGILDRWKSHLEYLFDDQSRTLDNLLHNSPSANGYPWCSHPMSSITQSRACRLQNKTIVFTHGGPELKNHLMCLILKIWDSKSSPLRTTSAMHLSSPSTRRKLERIATTIGVSHSRKISVKFFTRILPSRHHILTEDVLPQSQCGFRPSRGTIDMTFCPVKNNSLHDSSSGI